jgi:hypothetical protein
MLDNIDQPRKTSLSISLSNGVVIHNVEHRIRDYCRVEIYRGYDDQHTIDDIITKKDIESANKLYAMIDRYNKNESKNILMNNDIPKYLTRLSNKSSLNTIAKWDDVINQVKPLFDAFHRVKGFGLAKTTKILHLKRPALFPILDSYLIKLIEGVNMLDISKTNYTNVGIQALQTAHRDVINNIDAFNELENRLQDLPIRLTTARMYDILCWTQEKWINRSILTAPFGEPIQNSDLSFRESI